MEKAFDNYVKNNPDYKETPIMRVTNVALISSLSAIHANTFSCFVTHPLDMIRARMYYSYYNKDSV